MRRWFPLLLSAAALLFFAHRGFVSAASKATNPDYTTVQLKTPEGGTDAFVAMPAGEGPAPAVIVVHEWWGLSAQIQDVARQLARQGYVAIVPDLYHGKVADGPEDAHELMRGLEDTRVFSELDAARAWLASQPRTAKSKAGITGFCMGGGISLRYALRTPALAAVVMFYGPPETDPEKLATLRAPLMGHFGAEDQGIAIERVNAFRSALAKAGKSAQIFEYSGAGHAFMHEGRPSYRADAARVAWARTLAFLQKNLKS